MYHVPPPQSIRRIFYTLIPIFWGQLIPISRPPQEALGKEYFRTRIFPDLTESVPDFPRAIPRQDARRRCPRRGTSKRPRRAKNPRPPVDARGDAPSGRSTRSARSARRGGDCFSRLARLGEGRAPARPGFTCSAPAIGCRPPAFIPNAHVLPCLRGLPCARGLPNACGFPCARGLPFESALPFERGVDGPEERRARVPAPLHEPPRRREMRFHCVIILKAVATHGVTGSAWKRGAQWSGRNEISPRNNLS